MRYFVVCYLYNCYRYLTIGTWVLSLAFDTCGYRLCILCRPMVELGADCYTSMVGCCRHVFSTLDVLVGW